MKLFCKRLAPVAAAVIWLFGCSQVPVADLQFSQPVVELSQVPFFPQRRKQCGAAALATVLAYYQKPVTAQQLEDYLYIPGKEGSLAIEIVAQARQQGMLVYVIDPDLNAILKEVSAGHPVLVMQNLGLSWLPQWHFAVVIGFDLAGGNIILRSGNDKRRVVAIKTFWNTWQRANTWGIVITPPEQIPVTAKPVPFLSSAVDLEQVKKTAEAALAYQAALRQWPDNSRVNDVAYLGLANLAYQQNKITQAKKWLLQALDHNPRLANGWNNLAYVLLEQACYKEAAEAVACAVALEPDSPVFQESYEEIKAFVFGEGQAKPQEVQCSIPRCHANGH